MLFCSLIAFASQGYTKDKGVPISKGTPASPVTFLQGAASAHYPNKLQPSPSASYPSQRLAFSCLLTSNTLALQTECENHSCNDGAAVGCGLFIGLGESEVLYFLGIS